MADTMTTYTATVRRDSGKWIASLNDLPGGHTFANSLNSLRTALKEVVILLADLPHEATPDIRLVFDLDDPMLLNALDLAERRKRLAQEEAAVAQATASAVQQLARAGYSTRDVAGLIGVTPGRVSQISPRHLTPA